MAPPKRFLERIMTATDDFAVWFRAQGAECHGFGPSSPPPPPSRIPSRDRATPPLPPHPRKINERWRLARYLRRLQFPAAHVTLWRARAPYRR